MFCKTVTKKTIPFDQNEKTYCIYANMIWSYQARNTDECKIICGLVSKLPVIVTDLNQRIVGVNGHWVDMCKFAPGEAFGMTPAILQGTLTSREAALDFAMQLSSGRMAFTSVLNYKKDGTQFVNHLCGWSVGDLLVAETYTENAVKSDRETIVRPLGHTVA